MMTRQLRRKLPGTPVLTALSILLAGCSGPAGRSDLPAFELATVADSRRLVTAASLVERPALVNVWASWCLACRDEHQLLMELAKSGQVALYGVNHLDTREDAQRWLDYFGDPFVLSVFDAEGGLGKRMGVDVLPQTFLLGADGRIVHSHIGPLSDQVLERDFWPRIRVTEATRQ